MARREEVSTRSIVHCFSVFLIDGVSGRSYTNRELQTFVRRFADGLRRRGYGLDDRVCIMSGNCPEYIVALLAVPAFGAILSGLNPTFTTHEAIRQVNDAEAKVFILCSSQIDKAAAIKMSCPTLQEIIVIGESGMYTTFDDVVRTGSDAPIRLKVNAKDKVALLPYSSGTTGVSKGVMITHHNLSATLLALGPDGMQHVKDGVETMLLIFPIYHIGGISAYLLPALYNAATVITYRQFDFEQFLEAIPKYQVTWTALPPPVLVRLSKDPLVTKFDFSTLMTIFTGAAPVAKEVVEVVGKLFPHLCIRQGYGMTENTGVSHYIEPGKPRLGSTGPVVPGLEYKVVDTVSRRLLGPGEDGEIEVRGEFVMKGYWKRPDATAETIDSQGWQKTGDIGHYDEDGHLYPVDRIKDLIKYKAFQVAPAELEALLLTHPDVAETAVVGVPDESSGELPRAFVKLKPGCKTTAADLYNYAKERTAPYKWLRGGVIFVDDIPKNPSGKLLRRLLRDKTSKKTVMPKSKY